MSTNNELVLASSKKASKKDSTINYLKSSKNGKVTMETSANNVSNIQENVKGAYIEKVKRELSALQGAKIEANNEHKKFIFSFNFNLESFKTRGQKYLNEFNTKHSLNVTMAQVQKLTASDLCKFMSAKDIERQKNNGNKWSFWMVETLVAKNFAPIKVKKVK